MNSLINIFQKIKNNNYTLQTLLSDLTSNKIFLSLSYKLQDKIQNTSVNLMLELSQIKKSTKISDDEKKQLVKDIINDIDNRFKSIITDINSETRNMNIHIKITPTPLNKTTYKPLNKSTSTPLNKTSSTPLNKTSSTPLNKTSSTPLNKTTTKTINKNLIPKNNFLINLKKNPFFYLIEKTDIVKKIQNLNLITKNNILSDEEIFKLCKIMNKNFIPIITNSLHSESPKVLKMFKLTFLKPLKKFRQSTNNLSNDSDNKKFSSILNIGNHWASLTVIPSKKNPNFSYAIYRDSFGKKPEQSLVNAISKIYPKFKIAHSNKVYNNNSISSGIFASLASFGDICIPNHQIILYFDKCIKNNSVDKFVNGIDHMIQKKVTTIRNVNDNITNTTRKL